MVRYCLGAYRPTRSRICRLSFFVKLCLTIGVSRHRFGVRPPRCTCQGLRGGRFLGRLSELFNEFPSNHMDIYLGPRTWDIERGFHVRHIRYAGHHTILGTRGHRSYSCGGFPYHTHYKMRLPADSIWFPVRSALGFYGFSSSVP